MVLICDFGNLLLNVCYLMFFGEQVKGLVKEFKGLKVEVFDEKKLCELGMGLFFVVVQGSDQLLWLIVL